MVSFIEVIHSEISSDEQLLRSRLATEKGNTTLFAKGDRRWKEYKRKTDHLLV